MFTRGWLEHFDENRIKELLFPIANGDFPFFSM
jgi:hypothetical protein